MAMAYPGLGFDPTPGSAAAVADVVARLAQGCAQVEDCVVAQTARGWTGEAAEAYGRSAAEAPRELARLRRSLEKAAHTLAAWQSRLLDNQREAARLDALARSLEAEGDRRETLAAAERLRARHLRQAAAVATALRDGWVWDANASALSASRVAAWSAGVSWLGAPPMAGATPDVQPVATWVNVATPDGRVVTLPIARPGEVAPTDRPDPALAEGVVPPTSRTPAGATPAYLTDAYVTDTAGLDTTGHTTGHTITDGLRNPALTGASNQDLATGGRDLSPADGNRNLGAGGARPERTAGGTRHLATPDGPTRQDGGARHAAGGIHEKTAPIHGGAGSEPRRHVAPHGHAGPATGPGATPHGHSDRVTGFSATPPPHHPAHDLAARPATGPATDFSTVAESSGQLPPPPSPTSSNPTADPTRQAPPPGPTSDYSAPAEPTKQPTRLPSNTPLTNGIPADALRQAPPPSPTPDHGTPADTGKQPTRSPSNATTGNPADMGKHTHPPNPTGNTAEPKQAEPTPDHSTSNPTADEREPGDVILPIPVTLPSTRTTPTPIPHGLDIFLLHHGGRRLLVLADNTSDTALFLPVLQGVS